MYNAAYGYQADDYPVITKKRFNILGNLLRLRRILILFLVVIVAFSVWPQVHFESYKNFRVYLRYIVNDDVFNYAKIGFLKGCKNNPISRILELLIVLACIWKFILRGKILAFIRIKSIVMVALSSFWIYLILFETVNIEQFSIWKAYMDFMVYSPVYVYLYPIAGAYALRAYAVAALFIFCYLATVLFYGSSAREGQRLDRSEMEELGITEVIRRVNPIRRLFLPRQHFYVTDSFSQNAYSTGRNVVIAIDICNEGIDVVQGVVAHELGHYYHYDTDASMICNVAINTVAFPFMILTFLFRILSYIPFLGIAVSIYSILISIFGVVTGIIFKSVNLLFYWADGKWAERNADMFGVDLGFGFGNYLFLSKYADGFSFRAFISGFFDVHPGIRSRCRYIKKRIIRNYGEDYWDSCVAVYGDYYV